MRTSNLFHKKEVLDMEKIAKTDGQTYKKWNDEQMDKEVLIYHKILFEVGIIKCFHFNCIQINM